MLTLSSVLVADFGNKSFTVTIPITCKTERENKIVETQVLLDTGAGGLFMHPQYAKKNNILLYKLPIPIIPRNVDGTKNQIGKITYFTWIRTEINGRKCLELLLICNIGSSDIIFGLPWFQEYNPLINWRSGRVRIPQHTTETVKEYYRKNQRRKKETTIPVRTDSKLSRKEMSPRKNREEDQTASSTTLHANIWQRESDENPNWRKKFVKRREEREEITIVHPEITTVFIKKPEDISIVVQQLKKAVETRLQKKSTPQPYKSTIEEIIDEDIHKNHTQNPLPNDETTLIEAIEIDIENEEELLINYIQGEDTADLWVNKMNIATELAKKDAEKKEEKTLEQMVPRELMKYKSVFDEVEASRFPESRPWDHAIDLKDDFIPKDCPIYPLSLPEQGKLQEFIDDNLQKGYIRPSKSPMASPFFFVDKKDGKLRPCQDYRTLNEGTIKNTYPLPLISELVDQLKGAKYFTKLDIRWGYNNVRIKDGDQWKAAFKTNLGLFEPTVMFFGLTNFPATFQTMMNEYF